MAGRNGGRPRSRSIDGDRELRRRGKEKDSSGERRHHSRSPSPRRRSASPSRPSRSPDRRRRHKSRSISRAKSRSGSRSSSDSRRRRKREKKDRHRDKKRRHSRSRSRSRSRDSSRERDRKKKKRHKKDRKDKKSEGTVTAQWGKYGILSESDIFTKEQEFHAWILEEKLLNPEGLSKQQLKKLFQSFMEDYNTATLPHEKFYNLEVYERRMAGEVLPSDLDAGTYDPVKDMASHKARTTIRRQDNEPETYLNREQLQELRRVQSERVQIGKMKALGLEVKNNMGVRMDGVDFE